MLIALQGPSLYTDYLKDPGNGIISTFRMTLGAPNSVTLKSFIVLRLSVRSSSRGGSSLEATAWGWKEGDGPKTTAPLPRSRANGRMRMRPQSEQGRPADDEHWLAPNGG
ncbi:hypothetical protein BJ165DRAFT_1407922 [Panaeolus papilionaceus]|nr:hypothetical protein BJ165DRAFT_1407922 [Panaeolus papilionaceus]